MLKVRNLFAAVAVLLSGVAVADWESSLLPRNFMTESTLDKALATAKRSDKSVIMYYTRSNCPPCNLLQGRLRKDSVAAQFRDSYVFTAVWGSAMGADERESYRVRFGIQGAPTWVVFTNDGKYVCTSDGGFTTDEGALVLHNAVQVKLSAHEKNMTSEPRRCV